MADFEVVIKKVADVRAATLRGIIPSYAEPQKLWAELMGHIGKYHAAFAGPCFTLYHDECYKEKDVDAEVAQPVEGDVPASDRVTVRTVPGAEQMACLVHTGPYAGLKAAYQVLTTWLEENGYKVVGPDREVYLKGPADADDPSDFVTEIMFPVAKA